MKKLRTTLLISIIALVISILTAITTLIIIPWLNADDTSQSSSGSHSSLPQYEILKPILYFYPQADTTLTVQLGHPNQLTASYPQYPNGGWQITAHPDGTLTDISTSRTLYSLYWEGARSTTSTIDQGFVVAGADTADFLEAKLAALGLTSRGTTIDADMPLSFSVQPDTIIRVWMVFTPADSPQDLPTQQLPDTPRRSGFTVVEWGGSELSSSTIK